MQTVRSWKGKLKIETILSLLIHNNMRAYMQIYSLHSCCRVEQHEMTVGPKGDRDFPEFLFLDL